MFLCSLKIYLDKLKILFSIILVSMILILVFYFIKTHLDVSNKNDTEIVETIILSKYEGNKLQYINIKTELGTKMRVNFEDSYVLCIWDEVNNKESYVPIDDKEWFNLYQIGDTLMASYDKDKDEYIFVNK